MIENQKPILGADRAKKPSTVYRALRPSPKVVHAKDFTSTEGAGDNNLEPQQREPESLTSDNDEVLAGLFSPMVNKYDQR